MDNREAIASLKTLCNTCTMFPKCVNSKPECFQAIETAISALKKQEQERWIPVTERLPEENGRYIICYEDATTFLDYFNGKWFFPLGKHAMACEETGTIVAWRPLPEPYTEEES